MKELPPSAPYRFTFNSQKRDETYIINQLLERPSTQLPQANAETQKQTLTLEYEAVCLTKIPL